MAKQDTRIGNPPLESSLTDLILNTKSEKIRRPPNAFMLFARDQRKLVSKQHPDVSNKGVSSILGQIWKNTPHDVKVKYYTKAKILGDLHKKRYPDYVYSPIHARLQKMNRKKKKDEVNSTDTATQREKLAAVMELTKRNDNPNQEVWITNPNNDPKSSPEYIPNNPEYFAQQSPEEDETSDFRQESDDSPQQMDQGCWTEKNGSCCNQNRLGTGVRCALPHVKRDNEGVIRHFPDHIPCSYATTPPFCSPPPHFTGPMSSYCCGQRPCTSPIPRPYGPPLHSYWNPSPYYPGREYFYDDLKPCPFSTPYHVSDFYGPYGYFDRPLTQTKKNFDTSFHPYLRESTEFPRRGTDGSEADHTGPYSYFNRPDGKEENIHRTFNSCLRTEDERVLQNRRILRSSGKNQEQMIHQNQANKTGIRLQDEPNSHTSLPQNEQSSLLEERKRLNSHFYPNLWGNHYGEDKWPEMVSSVSTSMEQYQCDSARSNENQDSSDLANNSHTQSDDILSSTLLPESNKHKLDTLYADGKDDTVTSTHPNLYRLSNLPTYDAARPHFWSSTQSKSSVTKDNIQEIFHKPVTILDQPIYTIPKNNMNINSNNKHLSNANKISPNFVTGTQDKNRLENTIVDKEGIPLNISFSNVPVQVTKEYSKEFDSSNLLNNQILTKNHNTSAKVQQSQIYKPLVKIEFNDQNIYPTNEIN